MLMKQFAKMEKKQHKKKRMHMKKAMHKKMMHEKKHAVKTFRHRPAQKPAGQVPEVGPDHMVQMFVKHNLRKNRVVKQEKRSLADLLKFGVHLRTGGMLYF